MIGKRRGMELKIDRRLSWKKRNDCLGGNIGKGR
jgi:hypothetical protein